MYVGYFLVCRDSYLRLQGNVRNLVVDSRVTLAQFVIRDLLLKRNISCRRIRRWEGWEVPTIVPEHNLVDVDCRLLRRLESIHWASLALLYNCRVSVRCIVHEARCHLKIVCNYITAYVKTFSFNIVSRKVFVFELNCQHFVLCFTLVGKDAMQHIVVRLMNPPRLIRKVVNRYQKFFAKSILFLFMLSGVRDPALVRRIFEHEHLFVNVCAIIALNWSCGITIKSNLAAVWRAKDLEASDFGQHIICGSCCIVRWRPALVRFVNEDLRHQFMDINKIHICDRNPSLNNELRLKQIIGYNKCDESDKWNDTAHSVFPCANKRESLRSILDTQR